jgi:hypothetical protein
LDGRVVDVVAVHLDDMVKVDGYDYAVTAFTSVFGVKDVVDFKGV